MIAGGRTPILNAIIHINAISVSVQCKYCTTLTGIAIKIKIRAYDVRNVKQNQNLMCLFLRVIFKARLYFSEKVSFSTYMASALSSFSVSKYQTLLLVYILLIRYVMLSSLTLAGWCVKVP